MSDHRNLPGFQPGEDVNRYPDKVWEVESPNANSSALFESLHTEFPDRVKAPVMYE